MAGTQAFLGAGTIIERGDGASPQVFTSILEVVSFGSLGAQNDLIEATHLLSTAKEYIYGLADGIQTPLVVNYKPADPTHIGLINDNRTRRAVDMKLKMTQFSPLLTFTFTVLVLGISINYEPNNVVHMTSTLKFTGAILGPS